MQVKKPFYLTSMDPGGITGLTVLRVDEEDFTVERQLADPYDPLRGKTPAHTLQSWLPDFASLPHLFLYENFHLRPQSFLPDPLALNVIGGVETWLAAFMKNNPVLLRRSLGLKSAHSTLADLSGSPGCPYAQVIPREPVEGKHPVPDSVLERLGLKAYGPLTRDINDAFRHAVSWLTAPEQKYRPMCERAWPRRS